MSKTNNIGNDTFSNPHVLATLRSRLHIPEEIRNILPESDDIDGIDMKKLVTEVVKGIELLLNNALDALNEKELGVSEKEQASKTIFECLTCLRHLSDSKGTLQLVQIKFKLKLHSIITDPIHEYKVKNAAALVSEKIIADSIEFDIDDDGEWALQVYLWLLNTVEKNDLKNSSPLVKRVAAMGKVAVKRAVPLPSVPLLRCVTDERYLAIKEGRQHIASLFTHSSMLAQSHGRVMEALPTLPASAGHHYGDIYFTAWTHASRPIKTELENNCIQSFVKFFLELDRSGGTELTTPAKIIFRILSYLHSNRVTIQFSVALSKLYMPVIWRATKSDHPIKRCNAAQLLFDIFPMEKCEGKTAENNLYKEKQFNELLDLLMDECHYCRIIAIRGAARVMSDVVTVLSTEQWNKLLFMLADDLAKDGSSPLVRCEVFLALAEAVGSEKCAPLLAPVLPHLKNHFHDNNERVRKAFVKMLFCVHESPHLRMTYTDVVPMSHIIARLSLESEPVGSLLSKLLMPKFYYDNCNLADMISRLQKLILKSHKAAANLFRFSKAALSVQQVQLIITVILAHLRKVVKAKIGVDSNAEGSSKENSPAETSGDSAKSPQLNRKKKQKLMSSPLTPSNESAETSHNESCRSEQATKKEIPFEQLIECHTGLLICAQLGWLTFAKELNEPKNEELLDNLFKLTAASIQGFLRFYKGTPAFYAAVEFCSLVPVTKLSHETTVTTTCLSELQNATMLTPENHLKTVVHALCSWNRGHDVIYLVLDWIDPAFRHFQLNQSAVHVARGKRKTKVRFQSICGKEVLGIKILNLLFSDFLNEAKIISKQYEAVFELFKYLEQVKIIIESKFTDPKTVGNITNQFLLDCLELVYKISFALHKTKLNDREEARKENKLEESTSSAKSEIEPFSATCTFVELLEWANKVIYPHLPEISGDIADINPSDAETLFPLEIISGLVKACIVGIQIDQSDKMHIKLSIMFVIKLFETEWKFYFIQSGLNLLKAAGEFSEVWWPNDEEEIFSVVGLSLFGSCLSAIAETPPTALSKFHFSLKDTKKIILYFPLAALRIFGKQSSIFIKAYDELLLTCIKAILADIRKTQVLDARPTFNEQPFVVNLLMSLVLTKQSLYSELITFLIRIIDASVGDGISVSCVSLLFTLIKWNKQTKLKSNEMKEIINTLRVKLKRMSIREETEDSFDCPFDPCEEARKVLDEAAALAGCTVPAIVITRPSSPSIVDEND